jgi:hypothetical protein
MRCRSVPFATPLRRLENPAKSRAALKRRAAADDRYAEHVLPAGAEKCAAISAPDFLAPLGGSWRKRNRAGSYAISRAVTSPMASSFWSRPYWRDSPFCCSRAAIFTVISWLRAASVRCAQRAPSCMKTGSRVICLRYVAVRWCAPISRNSSALK